MRSSTGEHYLALDHVRAVAAFMVFCWHFLHWGWWVPGKPIPFDFAPLVFPLSFLGEGHIGVALFFALSGYLFAKLLNGRTINLPAFFWNRFIRLAPLLAVVTAIASTRFNGIDAYLSHLHIDGLPNGGWSIIVEFEFYILLPALLFISRYSAIPLWSILIAAVALRCAIWLHTGSIQSLSYWTLVGRMDQFLLGILAFYHRDWIVGRHWTAIVVFAASSLLWWEFNRRGGYFSTALDPLWIVIPTIQGAAFAFLIGYYDLTARWSGPMSRAIAKVGEWSYSIYLLHMFYVFILAGIIHKYVISLSNFYVALIAAFISFIATLPVCAACYYAVERPFLRARLPYLLPSTKVISARTADQT